MTSFLLTDASVLPCEGDRTWLDPCAVLVLDGNITAVGTPEQVGHHPAAESVERIERPGHVVIPGLHNCHLHSGLLRGTAESMAWRFAWRQTPRSHTVRART